MRDKTEQRLMAISSNCTRLGYIPDYFLNEIEKLTGVTDHHDKIDLVAAHSMYDEILPCVHGANFNNTGKPTYYLHDNGIRTFIHQKGDYDERHMPRWKNMNARCSNGNLPNYHNYGGRGIKVCDAWHRCNPTGRKNYSAWLDKITPEELKGKYWEADRRNNSDYYHPGNLRVVTKQVNAQNKRTGVLDKATVIKLRDEARTKTPNEYFAWSETMQKRLGVARSTFNKALNGTTFSNVNVDSPPITDGMVIKNGYKEIYEDMAKEFMYAYNATGIRLRPWCKDNAHRWSVSGIAARRAIFKLLPESYRTEYAGKVPTARSEDYVQLTADIVARLREESRGVLPIDYTDWLNEQCIELGQTNATLSHALSGRTWEGLIVPGVSRDDITKSIYWDMAKEYQKNHDGLSLRTWCRCHADYYGVHADTATHAVRRLLPEDFNRPSKKRKPECDGVVFGSIGAAARHYQVAPPTITKRCNSATFPNFKFI